MAVRILIGCETSGMVREAFRALGHDAYSADLLPSDDGSPFHVQCDHELHLLDIAQDRRRKWDCFIVHPPCTYLTLSAAWAFKDGPYHQKVKPGTLVGADRREARERAIQFVRALWGLPIERKAIENPRGFLSTMWKPFTQEIQPYQFGADASKGTCLWLQNLPILRPTQYVEPRIVEWPKGSGKLVKRWSNQTDSGQNNLTPSGDRWKPRSKTYPGIARAMAEQWSNA